MRLLGLALVVTAACHGSPPSTLALAWRGVTETPKANSVVQESFAAAPFSFTLRDVRTDPSAVGGYDDDSTVVHTRDNVGQFCGAKLGEILISTGARIREQPIAALETELLEYSVIEGGTFAGKVSLRAIVHRGDAAWSKVYTGTSKRWGRSHSPENFNEALSNALADVAEQLVTDDAFGHALNGDELPQAPPPTKG
ncbi:hypothetical protein BH11MYX1_BH11MYX1_39160 [soil metagenome]